ncbi:uncharacterized protein LOC106181871 isoform X2 [Lingula anatina]|uniref:Large ribosomal subunit protein uL30m n=1 Tax=Lingula anatina TaxID=7574 RepID=A0A1S3KGS8_LINAN|nr:uncharacterized protein LOC106181871 isoform X1 [Lingula anatina]XP_013421844.1 uncharacterized protein LOC106181871 isoform X2 [Lingula anatina]|eukprot:XP_013421843.1 uncharacterized protein LOC106181871 isoform X1 [Lingula anatina]
MAGIVLNKLKDLQRPCLVVRTCATVLQMRHKSARKFFRAREYQNWKKKRDADKTWAEPLLEYQKMLENGPPPPEIEPAPLHAVSRIRPVKGVPWWEKQALERLGLLNTKMNELTVHKNTPGINVELRKVNHLVKVVPVRFPHGLPEDPSDFDHAKLKSNGEFVVNKSLKPQQAAEINNDEYNERRKWSLDGDTIRKEMRRKLERKAMHDEYYVAQYSYHYNQDGKEEKYDRWTKTVKGKEEKKKTPLPSAVPRPGFNT